MTNGFIKKSIVITLAFVFLAIAGYYLSSPEAEEKYVLSSGELPEEKMIIVTVSGEVKNVGKYSVAYGSSVHEVLYCAGGVTEKGDLSAIALDGRLFEDCTIHVPEKVYVLSDEVEAESALSDDELLNINTADIDKLDELPGIGEILAKNIKNYREVYGPFEKCEDIIKVPGIGEKKYNQIKDKITVGGN
ncbi:MAG: ComEA family DNA-binding protein [Clostridia bacterium]|nr:ComEA family DNA-binding protein [Clostridia bacterium]